MITGKPQLMSRLYQDQYQDALVGRCSSKLIESDLRCRIQVKLSLDVFGFIVKMAAMFSSRMGKKESMTLVGESWARFVELWACGKSATFHVECWNGDARLCFSTLLGRPEEFKKMSETDPSHFSQATVKSRKYSPSKLKRNQLRLQAFLEKKRRESCDTMEFVDEQSPDRAEQNTNMRKESCSRNSDTNDLNYPAESDWRIEKSAEVESPFIQVKNLLWKIDLEGETCENCRQRHGEVEGRLIWKGNGECNLGHECPASYWYELTAEERRRVRKGELIANATPGYYVQKKIFESLDDPFVYEIYLEVLAAQAQFEEIFGRQWGSVDRVDHDFFEDFSDRLFIPIKTVENLRYYLERLDDTSSSASSFPLESPGALTTSASSFPLDCPAEVTTSFHRPFTPAKFL